MASLTVKRKPVYVLEMTEEEATLLQEMLEYLSVQLSTPRKYANSDLLKMLLDKLPA